MSDDPRQRARWLTTRRGVLAVLAVGAWSLVGDAQSGGENDMHTGGVPNASVGGLFQYDAWNFAPPTAPPDEQPAAWVRRDGSAGGLRYDASLPFTFSANGAQWSVASDYATAKANVTSYPAIAVGGDKSAAIVDSSLPVVWTAGGVEHVVAADLSSARSAQSQAPAVLFPNDGSRPRAVVP